MLISGAAEAAKPASHENAGTAHRRRRLPPAAFAYLLIGGLVAIAGAGGILGPSDIALAGIGVATLMALVISVAVRRPSRVWPWTAIALALALFMAAGVARSSLPTMGNLTASRPLLPDLLALFGYALLASGLLGFSRRRTRGARRQSSVVLDGLIAALALAALAWVFVVQTILLQDHVPMQVTLALIAYPSMSIFMVVVTLRIVFNPEQERVPAFWFLLLGMTFLFVGDVVYMFADINLIDVPERLLNLPYALAYLGAGAAALHASMRKLTEPGGQQRMIASRFRIAVVAVALVIPALLTLQDRSASAADRVVLCLLMLIMTLAAVLRIVQALRAAETSEARLVFQANHDSLTGLPNRRMMEQHLSQILEKTPVDDTHVAVLYLDLDRFKQINDTLGHSHGDVLLVEVAARLRSNVRPEDLVTRIGGDEFMIILGDVVSVSKALDLANRLRSCLRAPFVVHGMTFYVSVSIGLAFASGDDPAATAEVLIRDADTAMYEAKDAGRDAVAVFDQSMRARMAERVELERDLHHAVTLNQLHLVYQPIVRLPRGTVVGMEALVRWSHPTHGVLTPAKFIPLAEENGLIAEIGCWVLEETVSQFAAWRRQAPQMEDLYVSVNLSGMQLHDDQIVNRVADVLTLNRLEGSSLCLELTESVVMEDPAAAAATLTALRQLGVRIAIDDFGSEYSSLAYLKRFPATTLKIDKSFVSNLAQPDSPDATLIATIVAMARALDITTVAEGVETSIQAARLLELGCDTVQGYLFSRPVGADRLLEVVTSLGTQRLHLVTA
jgi:diguanylate cyclase (GGDEF)-like protein